MLPHTPRQFIEHGRHLHPGIDEQDDAIRVRLLRIVKVLDSKRLDGLFHVFATQTKPQGGIEAVDDMQVMGPAFGPIFPRMDRCVRTNVFIRPILGRTVRVVPLECRRVFLSLIAVQISEPIEFFAKQNNERYTIHYIEASLNEDTTHAAAKCKVVCIFVIDACNARSWNRWRRLVSS